MKRRKRVHGITDPSFSPLAEEEEATNQTVKRDGQQAMPRAEPALSLAPLPLSAVVGAAITTAITTTLWLPLGKPSG